jgi:hypothetical protein
MDVQSAFDNLNPIALFGGCIIPIIATPVGFFVALAVRRTAPLVNVLTTTILAAYIVSTVMLFVLLRRLIPETALSMPGAATISFVVSAGLVFFVTYAIHRRLFSQQAALKAAHREEQTFSVYGEDVRGKAKNQRRRKR